MAKAWLRGVLGLIVIACMAPPTLAQNCLDEAQISYRNMRLSEAIGVLEDCRGRQWPDLETSQKTAALRLLAISYFASRDSVLATGAVVELLGEDRGYRTDPDGDPEFFQRWVGELRPKAWYQKRWIQITGGLLIGGTVGYLLFKPETKLPLPGDFFPPSN